jgi:protocatechuate 4,5-dioxygenase alpha chain
MASIQGKLKELDSWLRNRLRHCIWHDWKKPERKRKNLLRLGVPKWQAYAWSRTRKGGWAVAQSPILGTTITLKRLAKRDAEQMRKGYWLNQFCVSLMKAENRERFKANERAYLDEWQMSEEQKQAVLDRDLNRCVELGGNIYFLARIGATDGRSFQYMAASMSGVTQDEYAKMMREGGRSPEGNRSRQEKARG